MDPARQCSGNVDELTANCGLPKGDDSSRETDLTISGELAEKQAKEMLAAVTFLHRVQALLVSIDDIVDCQFLITLLKLSLPETSQE